MRKIREFFGITKSTYTFEMCDLNTLLTILNVAFILLGFWWAPIFGLINCGLSLITNVLNRVHINLYIMQIALVVLNIYFLTL